MLFFKVFIGVENQQAAGRERASQSASESVSQRETHYNFGNRYGKWLTANWSEGTGWLISLHGQSRHAVEFGLDVGHDTKSVG